MSQKNPVTPPGIDPGTVRLVAQRLNHYVTPAPTKLFYKHIYAKNNNQIYILYYEEINQGMLTPTKYLRSAELYVI